jgi:hypothetical protein
MVPKWNSNGTFHLGINMAGAVSAGAYTAGVLDFLMEALEEWYAAKASASPAVPLHDVSLDVFSGASAGGMCAAISAAMVRSNFQHIRNPSDPTVRDTNNKFYESWVNRIDIEPLLGDLDLAEGRRVISLLDSTVIDEIGDYALAPGPVLEKPYISKSLTLFLTLTNVRGTPFSMNGDAPGSAEEEIAYYADTLQFESVNGFGRPVFSGAKPLPFGSDGGDWPLLKEAAKATGAFPIFLAPRQIERKAADYLNSPWLPVSVLDPPSVAPHWPLSAEDTITTLNIDGGMTDNDPFELANDFLAIQNPLATRNPQTGRLENPPFSDTANCAVLTVAPFPASGLYEAQYDMDHNSSVLGMLPKLLSVLVAQSRFLSESLSDVMSNVSFSRFILSPSDADNPTKPALQCGLLGAFGGFFERGFRAHDYQLGRRNCQKLLRDYFRLSIENPIIAAGLNQLDPETRSTVIETFDPLRLGSIPLIPLCGTAVPDVPPPARATIRSERLAQIVDRMVDRLHAITKPLLNSSIGGGFDCWAAQLAAKILISTWGKAKLKAALQKELAEVISD